ncbi:hypothetical protein SAMN04488127_0774 [Bhargavaea ginsengi]|uniref:Uncharacterized protein n=1 Tax=Bhargavaea ginsengi TaxID=426757 RepID=A0A1H6UTU0_9BACL|nr:hypothetical protein [Bhargavaea ginsengi]SEI91352.1 hypothetical protein SAMN04488127_0774 [Bhargavaea ginsengi]
MTKREKLLGKLEGIWEGYSFRISFLMGIAMGILYYLGVLENIRSTLGNAITFSSIVIGVNGVFLTLVITLQESLAFTRLKAIMPSFQTRLYLSLRNQIQYGLVTVIISIGISVLPYSPHKFYSAIGVSVFFTFFWIMTLGSFYTVKLVTDIIVKNFDPPTRKTRK